MPIAKEINKNNTELGQHTIIITVDNQINDQQGFETNINNQNQNNQDINENNESNESNVSSENTTRTSSIESTCILSCAICCTIIIILLMIIANLPIFFLIK